MQETMPGIMRSIRAAASWIGDRLRSMPEAIRVIGSTLVFGWLTHGFFYANMLLAHDAIKPYGAYFSALRWSTLLFYAPRAFLLLPWVIGLISLLELGVINLLLARMFSIRKLASQLLLVITTVTFPSVVAFHNYGSVDLYMGSLLLGVLAAYWFTKKGIGNFLLAVLFLTISIASYQAFLCTTAALMLLLLLARLILQEEKVMPIVRDGVKALLILILSVAIYYGVYLIFVNITAAGVSDYRNENAMGVFTARELLLWAKQTYSTVVRYYLGKGINPLPAYIQALQLVCMGGVLIGTAAEATKRGFFRQPMRITLTVVILALMPMAINAIQLLNSGLEPQHLMTFAFVVPWIVVLQYGEWLLAEPEEAAALTKAPRNEPKKERGKPRTFKRTFAILCAVLICCNAYYGYLVANADYVARKLNYDASVSLATRIVARIENTEGYTLEMPVVFVGELLSGDLVRPRKGFELAGDIVGSLCYTGQAMTYNNELGSTVEWFISVVLSSNMVFVPDEQIDDYVDVEEVKNLQAFPARNCAVFVDGVLVFKLNNEYTRKSYCETND